jgi:hypothetical protein
MILSSRIKLLLEFRHPVGELGGEIPGVPGQSVFVLLDGHSPLKKLRVKLGVEQIAQFRAEPHQGFAKVFAFPRVMAGQDFEMGGGVGQFFEYCVVTYRAQI